VYQGSINEGAIIDFPNALHILWYGGRRGASGSKQLVLCAFSGVY